jgi:hypothetical protein
VGILYKEKKERYSCLYTKERYRIRVGFNHDNIGYTLLKDQYLDPSDDKNVNPLVSVERTALTSDTDTNNREN